MKIALSTDGDHVSAHFGRCPQFTIVDIEEGKVKEKQVVDNPGHAPGFIPQFLHKMGVEVIVAGGMGARASGFFEELGMKAIAGITGTIDETIKQFVGDYKPNSSLLHPAEQLGFIETRLSIQFFPQIRSAFVNESFMLVQIRNLRISIENIEYIH